MSNKGIIRGFQSYIDNSEYANSLNRRTVFVAQGGGQSGIFTSGVLDAFLLSNFDPFDAFYGTSAGALNICSYLLDLLNGGGWFFGAGDVYRLSPDSPTRATKIFCATK